MGDLFDAHFHIPHSPGMRHIGFKTPVLGEDVTIEEILCTFQKEKVIGSIAFYVPQKTNTLKLPDAPEIKRAAQDRITLFITPANLSAEELDKVFEDNGGLFSGIGEVTFYDLEQRSGRKLDQNDLVNIHETVDSQWAAKIYQLAAKRDIPVMFHPGQNQSEKIEKVLTENPKTKFYLHGFEVERDIDRLMAKYPNVYYSVDSAVLYAMRGKFALGPEDQFLSTFKKDFNLILDEGIKSWKDRIERYPDRFTWGTDRFATWHYEDELSSLMEEFARAFIGRLDPAVQERYAYKNAESLLK